MIFGPTVVAPAFRALGSIAPHAAQIMQGGLDRNKAAWTRMSTSDNCNPMSVLTDNDGCERALCVYGGSALEGENDPAVCKYALCRLLLLSNALR